MLATLEACGLTTKSNEGALGIFPSRYERLLPVRRASEAPPRSVSLLIGDVLKFNAE